jgi:hypothetical protein
VPSRIASGSRMSPSSPASTSHCSSNSRGERVLSLLGHRRPCPVHAKVGPRSLGLDPAGRRPPGPTTTTLERRSMGRDVYSSGALSISACGKCSSFSSGTAIS